MIAGDQWMLGGHSPTPEDWQKYRSQGYRLLMKAEGYHGTFCAMVQNISPNGAYIEVGSGMWGMGGTWLPMLGTIVLDIVEYPKPVEKPKEGERAINPAYLEAPYAMSNYIATTTPKPAKKKRAPRKKKS